MGRKSESWEARTIGTLTGCCSESPNECDSFLDAKGNQENKSHGYGPKCAKNNETTVNKALKRTIIIATIASRSVNHRGTWESAKEDCKSSGLHATRCTVAVEYLAWQG